MNESKFVYVAWLTSIMVFLAATFGVLAWVKATAIIALMIVAIVGLDHD